MYQSLALGHEIWPKNYRNLDGRLPLRYELKKKKSRKTKNVISVSVIRGTKGFYRSDRK
jgi:hypothetical protein